MWALPLRQVRSYRSPWAHNIAYLMIRCIRDKMKYQRCSCILRGQSASNRSAVGTLWEDRSGASSGKRLKSERGRVQDLTATVGRLFTYTVYVGSAFSQLPDGIYLATPVRCGAE